MAIGLYPHNQTAYEAVEHMLTERNKAAVVHPTGTGKTFIGFKLCEAHADKTVCWLSPSRYIYQTQLESLRETSGYEPENVVFHTYAKLMLLSDTEFAEIQPDYIILDEFHRCGAEYWGFGVQKLLKLYPDAKILGLSATAIRYLDNQRNMTEELFDGNIASEMTLGEAIVRGILNPPKYILSIFSYQKDFEKYEKRVQKAKNKATQDAATAYLEALRRALDKAENLDTLFDKHMTDRTGKYIVFCANVEHMQDMIDMAKEWFHLVDKKPKIYKVYSDDPTASKEFKKFKEDKSEHLKLLYCIDALNEGVHVPDVSGVILLRPTVSPIIYKQQIGRALSASKTHNPIIFDIVNNIENLYSIDTIKEEMKIAIGYYRSHEGEGMVVNDTFELIDKVADCRNLFEELEGTLSASWDMMFEQAKKYYEENENLDIPKMYYTPDGYSLGLWLATQRNVYHKKAKGILTQTQIDKLNTIGMRWDTVKDLAWNKYYESAKQYFEKNGNLLVLASYVDELGIDLGRWISQLRIYRKSGVNSSWITEERIKQLDEIHMVWDVLDYVWEENYSAAVRYHKEHGDLNVPSGYIDANGIRLGNWITSMRYSRKGNKRKFRQLSNDEIKRLDAIGMIWDNRYEKQWNDMFDALCSYYATHNSLVIPATYVTDSGLQLGQWLKRQEKAYNNGTISEDHLERLKGIGLVFVKKMNPWDEKFSLAKAYYEENGSLIMPPDYTVNGVWLYKWLNEQKLIAQGKRKNKKHTPEQTEKLCSIGFTYEETDTQNAWMQMYELAKTYYSENDNLNVPDNYTVGVSNLGKWIQIQKKQMELNKLSEERKNLLLAIGMAADKEITTIAETYEVGFAHLEQHTASHGLNAVSSTVICEDGYKLGHWISNCKAKYKKGKLKEEYIIRFQNLGISFEQKDKWSERFQEVSDYFKEHDTTTIPKGYRSTGGINLNSWLNDQKKFYRQGKLSEERAEKLRSIGVKLDKY